MSIAFSLFSDSQSGSSHLLEEYLNLLLYSHLLKNFQQFVVVHAVKGFDLVNEAEIDVFLELSCFFNDPMDGSLISGSSAFSKSI